MCVTRTTSYYSSSLTHATILIMIIETNTNISQQFPSQIDSRKNTPVLYYIFGAMLVVIIITIIVLLKTASDANRKITILQDKLDTLTEKNMVANTTQALDEIIVDSQPVEKQTQKKLFNDGVNSFEIPNELYMSKDPAQPGLPYAQFKTQLNSSIQVDLSTELELGCVEVDHTEVVVIGEKTLEKIFYKGIQNPDLPNCTQDNTAFRAIWLHLPSKIDNIGTPTLAIQYDISEEQLALKIYDESLSTLNFK